MKKIRDQKILNYSQGLKKLGIDHKIVEHPVLKTAVDVQGYLGLTLADGLATLIMKAGDKYIAIIRRDDCQLDFEKIKKILGVRQIRMATPEEFKKQTRLPVGAARVYNPGLKTFLDKKLFEKEFLTGGTGSFICSFRYRSVDLKKIPGNQIVDISVISKKPDSVRRKRVFSGSRPTGKLHLGNYLGGLKGYIALQEKKDFDCIYGIVDLHALTSPYQPAKLQANIFEVALDYLACGLDPKKCHLMVQSQVPEHLELAYLLGTIYPVSRVEQLPTYKDKKKEQPKYINVGLFYYPILMAADILIYKAELVPVGIDQEPHLELTREVARNFNRMFPSVSSGQVIFPEPKRFATPGEYIPSLTGEGKMSKSVPGSYIELTDYLDTINNKLAKMPTDVGKGKKLPKEGGVAGLLVLVELFEGKEKRKEYEKQYINNGIRYADLKADLAKAIYQDLKPIQKRRKYYEERPKEVKKILEEGRKYCSQIAHQTLREAKAAMGLI